MMKMKMCRILGFVNTIGMYVLGLGLVLKLTSLQPISCY